jgi:hypothetical protein
MDDKKMMTKKISCKNLGSCDGVFNVVKQLSIVVICGMVVGRL